MKVCIAEKRDVARKIAKVLGAKFDQKDWFEGGGYYVTWCQGHLLEMRVKEAEGKWTLSNLPILPMRFELAPISTGKTSGGGYQEDANCKHRLYVIRKLVEKSDEIICCTDAAREGQLIFENVYRYIGLRKPCKRLWISDLTEKTIRKGFDDLHDNADYEDLGKAARMRAEGDWIVGINATRAFTLTANADVPLSLGRVQTPTLCMICQRYIENKNFKSEPFWVLGGETIKDNITFKYRAENRYNTESDGVLALESAKSAGALTVESVETERKNEDAPLLHDLASLQKLANSKYSLTAKQTLDTAQALYEKQMISYPRTGSRFVSEEVFGDIPEILRALTDHPVYGSVAERLLGMPLNRRSVNEEKITDHHGLIVTGHKAPSALSVIESQVYELVLIRFLEALSPVCVADVTVVEFSAGDIAFTTKGRREISLGWRGVCNGNGDADVLLEEVDDVAIVMTPLPFMKEGEKIQLGRLELMRDVTKPKPLLTDATLLSCMENAGKRIDDKSIAGALKGIGIGTAATRDSVIEEIIRRGYVFREKKKLVPTDRGLYVYDFIKDKEIANVEMTAKWEQDLNDIADGDRDKADCFLSGIKGYAIEIVDDIRTAEDIQRITAVSKRMTIKCPKCGKSVSLSDKGGRCDCGFCAWRTVSGKQLTDEQMKRLYEDGRTEVISGFKGKSGNAFSAALSYANGQLSFVFPEKASEDALKCPKCGEPLRFSEKSVWCPACKYTVWREVGGKKLTDNQLRGLIRKGRTSVLTGFKSKSGKPFEAALVLQDDGKVKFEFQNNK